MRMPILARQFSEKHGEKGGPAEFLQPILNAHARLDTLDAAIRQLSQSQPGQVLSPKRIVVGGVSLAVLVLGLIAIKAIFLGSDRGAATATTGRAPTSTIADGPSHDLNAPVKDRGGAETGESASTVVPENISGAVKIIRRRHTNGIQDAIFEADRVRRLREEAERSGEWDEIEDEG